MGKAVAKKAAKKTAGRKTKYTPATLGLIEHALKLGATHKIACGYAGISHETFYDWINTKPEFSELVKNAEAVGGIEWLKKIEEASDKGQWQAAAWKLERRYPNEYGRNARDDGDATGSYGIHFHFGKDDQVKQKVESGIKLHLSE